MTAEGEKRGTRIYQISRAAAAVLQSWPRRSPLGVPCRPLFASCLLFRLIFSVCLCVCGGMLARVRCLYGLFWRVFGPFLDVSAGLWGASDQADARATVRMGAPCVAISRVVSSRYFSGVSANRVKRSKTALGARGTFYGKSHVQNRSRCLCAVFGASTALPLVARPGAWDILEPWKRTP